jgi:hypothetical protein
MTRYLQIPTALAFCLLVGMLFSCKDDFSSDNYTAYFGGEVTNPLSRYVLLYKGNRLVDSLPLDKDNRFFQKFDSLPPGMYTFRHDPEYQYVYFEKNDSLMVSIDTRDFDESIVFSGRGEQKNNYLMETYLGNEKDREILFDAFDYELQTFIKTLNKLHQKNVAEYQARKEFIQWSEDFDMFARASIDYPYYARMEIFPVLHKLRTGKDLTEKLPADYYAFREKIDFNNPRLSNYSPFVKYLVHMLNNVAFTSASRRGEDADMALKANTIKLEIADTLFKNEKVRNTIVNNIAYTYFMEDQNMVNHEKFMETYNRVSTDKSQRNDIIRLTNSIRGLQPGLYLPVLTLVDRDGLRITTDKLINRKAIVVFWSSKAMAHIDNAAGKLSRIARVYPGYQIVCINLDDEQDRWLDSMRALDLHEDVVHMRCDDFQELKTKWALTKIHRTIVLNPDTSIKNAFTNILNADFENNLQ